MVGEFVGENKDYTDAMQLSDGKIIAKISNVNSGNKRLGNEVWIIESK